jgi:glycosyltransferase involved in cell wall biosynthesis
MHNGLNILMLSHHRRSRAFARPHAMAKHLVQIGFQVTLVLTSNYGKKGITESLWDGVHIVETPDLLWGRLRSGWDPWNTLNRLAFLLNEPGPYDIVHCFETRPATIYPALYYCRRYSLPLITDWNDWWGRGGIIDEFRPKWYRMIFGPIETYYEEAFRKRSDGLTVISSALKQRAVNMGIAENKICLIPGGTVPEQIPYRSMNICRQHVGLPHDVPVLCYISMDSHAELDLLMETLSRITVRHPKVKLIITGNSGSSPARLAKNYGVEDNIIVTGFLSLNDYFWYLGCVNVFILPFPNKIYNIGRWPNKLSEAICIGRPVVSNPFGDVKSIIEEHRIGLLAQFTPGDFAEKILALIENPSLADELGKNARDVALTYFDWRILIHRLEDFYESVLGNS